MSDIKTQSIMHGLPHFIEHDSAGFDRLKSRLGLNRRTCRSLLDSTPAKQYIRLSRKELLRKEKTSGDRDKALLFKLYGNPNFRRVVWTAVYDRIKQGDEQGLSKILPSLEYGVLSSYFDSDVDGSSSIRETFGHWPDLVQKLEGIAWADLTVCVWTNVRSQLGSWETLDEEQKVEAKLVIFSVATIVDDQRLLTAAVEQAPELEREFRHLVRIGSGDDQTTSDDVLDIWNELCVSLRSLSEKAAGPPPVVDTLSDIKSVVDRLLGIEESVRERSIPVLFDHLMARVDRLLADLANDRECSWLGEVETQGIRANWEDIRASITLDMLRKEIDRLDERVPVAVAAIHEVATTLSDVGIQRAAASKERTSDLASLHAWEIKVEEYDKVILTLRSNQRKARLGLLTELSPYGTKFEIVQPDTHTEMRTPSDQDASKSTAGDIRLDDQGASESSIDISTDEPSEGEASKTAESESDVDVAIPDCDKLKEEHRDVEPPRSASPLDDAAAPEERGNRDGRLRVPGRPSPAVDGEEMAPRTETPTNSVADQAMRRINEALLERRPRLAYAVQLARSVTNLGGAHGDLPIAVLEAALLADRLSIPDGVVANELTDIFRCNSSWSSVADSDPSLRDLHAMFALAGTLRPTVLSPQTGACAILIGLTPSDRLPAFYQFARNTAIESQRLQAVRVDSTVLRAAISDNAWNAERLQLVSDVQDWRERAAHGTIMYAAATAVWQRWLSQDGILHRMVELITSDDDSEAVLDEMVRRFKTRKIFNELVRETDRRELGRRKGKDIHAGALTQLYDRAQQAVEFARRHISLRGSRLSRSSFVNNALNRLRDIGREQGQLAVEELRTLSHQADSLLSGAANTAAYAIGRFRELFENQIEREPDPKDLAASAILYFPSIKLNTAGCPVGDRETVLGALLSSDEETLEASFDERLRGGEFATARRTLEWIEFEEIDDTTEMRVRFDKAIEEERRKLRYGIDAARASVERALSRGQLSPIDRDDHDSKLVTLEHRLSGSEGPTFEPVRTGIKKIADDVDRALDRQRQMAQEAFSRLEMAEDSSEFKAISEAIAQGDMITANELIERIRGSASISSSYTTSEQPQIFQGFFPASATAIEDAMAEVPSSRAVMDLIVRGGELGGINFGAIPAAQRQSAERMLNVWFALKRANRLSTSASEDLTILFSELGFSVRSVTVQRADRTVGEALIETVLVGARERCPVPAYGSFVNGRYRTVCVWGRPTEEDILQYAEDNTRRVATVVLYFGCLTRVRRENLARLTRERSHTLVVLDEVLLLFLCGERGSRLPVLFACAIPFAYVQPYVTTAGLVPPEMFYGREHEIREIADRAGPCFIYGGRQLGKTALLRAVARNVHAPDKNSYAVWIDLKGEGIGYDRAVGDIWSAIWRALQKSSAISDTVPEPNPNVRNRKLVDELIDHLCSRFDTSSGRVLLLLLDEADKFLEVDAQEMDHRPGTGYRESTRLKALMDRSQRSIKVVFAGLHNVLRTVAYSNHPLGHFGQPIQVGPLWQSAEALIREPLLASGYRFKNDSLVARILGHTNYYPNLIQLYGAALIKTMCSRRIAGPPLYEIDEEVIDETYLRNTNLRDMIRSRFLLTLQLDPRYEVIAYSIAYECTQNYEVLSTGLDYRQIDHDARSWWPEGFNDIEPRTDRFRSLLDEMEGLGVVRKASHDHYTLRNPNVLLLMGTDDEIGEKLLLPPQLPQGFEPDQFRARDPQAAEGPKRSPLTYRQEDLLRAGDHGVSIVCGLAASGFGDVLRFLKARASSDSLLELDGINDLREFEQRLHRLQANRGPGTTICAIPVSVPWSEKWVELALRRVDMLRRRGRRDKNMRVLFMADPPHLWELSAALEALNSRGLQWTILRPWSMNYLRQWFEDVGFTPDDCARVYCKTGGWPIMFERLHAFHQSTGDLAVALAQLDSQVEGFQEAFGFRDGQLELQRRALIVLAALDGVADFESLKELAEEEGVDEQTLRRSLTWAARLHLVRSVGEDAWKMDSVVARVVGQTRE